MLIAVQLPLVDVRPLLDVPTGRHLQPSFPHPDRIFARHSPDHYRTSFVAGLGPVRPRLRGRANAPWPSESYYIDTRSTIRVRRPAASRNGSRRLGGFPAYRNFYTDGVVGRLELGFRYRVPQDESPTAFLGRVQSRVLELPVRVAAAGSTAELVHFGPRFAGHLLAITTNRAEAAPPQPWLIQAGAPAVIAEITSDEELTPFERGIGYQPPGTLEQRWSRFGGVRVSLWTLRQGDSTPDEFRRLRVHVSRLHADFTAFDTVLGMCAAGKLDASYPPVESYLIRSVDLLVRRKRHGFAQAELMTYVVNAVQSAYADTLSTLDYLGGQIGSPQLKQRLGTMRAFLDESSGISIEIGEIVMSKYETTINGGTQGIVHGGSGDVSENQVSVGVGGEDLAALLAGLRTAMEELRGHLPPDAAVIAEDTAEGVRRELERPEAERDTERLGGRIGRLLGIAKDAGLAGSALAAAVTAIRLAIGL